MQADMLAEERGSIELPASMDYWDELFDFVQSEAQSVLQASSKEYGMILACEEILSNMIRYADSGDGDPPTIRIVSRIHADPGGRCFQLQISDSGSPYDPKLDGIASEVQDVPIEERPIGGLGLFLVKSSVDHVSYAREEGRNVYTLTDDLLAPS